FSSAPTASEDVYLHHLWRVLLALAARGRCVFVGRGAAQFLPAERTLRVRLVAPLAERVRSYQERHKVSAERAARQAEETDRERSRFVRQAFHKDPSDVSGYDLILNTARYPAEHCAELIEQALRRAEARVSVPAAAAP